MNLKNSQLFLVNQVKSFIKNSKAKGLPIFKLGTFYFAPFGESLGYAKVIYKQNKLRGILLNILIFLKSIYKISFLGKFKIINNIKGKNYKIIIFNWAYLKDFDKSGNFQDKHFNVNSKKHQGILWILVMLDKNIPEKIGNNVILITNGNNEFNFRILWNALKKSLKKGSISYFYHEASYFSALADFIYNKLDELVSKKTRKVLMPYEGQPFQNAIFKKTKKINQTIKTIGFIHSFPVGLPLNLIKKDGSPQKIIVSGESQSYCLNKFLGWKKKEIKILPSTRFIKSKESDMKNKIFLPISLVSSNNILDHLNTLTKKLEINISNFQIKNHPSRTHSKKHIKLIKKIKKIMHNSNSNKNKKNLSIFIGATGSVIEALGRNVEPIHICENPTLECYSEKLWKFIKNDEINKNVFKYRAIQKNKLIKFGKNANLFRKYI